MTIREKLAAYKDAVADDATDVVRYRLTTDQGFALLDEIDTTKLRHPERAAVAVALRGAIGAEPTGTDERLAWGQRMGAAVEALWEALEGQVVDGVTIIRRL